MHESAEKAWLIESGRTEPAQHGLVYLLYDVSCKKVLSVLSRSRIVAL